MTKRDKGLHGAASVSSFHIKLFDIVSEANERRAGEERRETGHLLSSYVANGSWQLPLKQDRQLIYSIKQEKMVCLPPSGVMAVFSATRDRTFIEVV